MIAFIATGYFATMGSIISSILSFLDSNESNLWTAIPGWKLDALKCLQDLCPRGISDPVGFWRPILEEFVLSLSNQQLITGLLLAVLSYPKYWLRDLESLVIVRDLVFFPMNTHSGK